MNIIPLNNNKESKDILLKDLDIDKTLVLILEQKNVVSLLDLLELNNKKILELVNFNEQYFLEVAAIINQEINTKRNYDLTRIKRLNINPHFLRLVDEIDWTVRTANCLKNSKILYIGDLIEKTESYLLRTPNFGRKSLREVRNVLKEMNLSLGMNLGEDWPPENIEEYKKHYQLDSLDVASVKYVPINQMEANTQTQPVTVKKKLEDAGIYNDAIAILKKSLETLSDREQDVIKRRYQEKLTLEEVGTIYQVTRERIRQIQAKALRKLKHPSRRFYFERINVLNEEHIWNALADGKNYIASQTINHPEYHPNLDYDTRISMEVCGGINNYLNDHYTQFDHGWIKGEINFDIKEINSYVDQIKQLLKEISYPIHKYSIRDSLNIPKNIFDICLDLSCSQKYKQYLLNSFGPKSKRAIDIYEFIASKYKDQLVDINEITASCRLHFNNFLKGTKIYKRYLMHLMQSYPHLFYRQFSCWRILYFNENNININLQTVNQYSSANVIEIKDQQFNKKEQLLKEVEDIDSDIPKFDIGKTISYQERLELIKQRYANAYEPWKNRDLDYLKDLYEDGRDITEIAKILKRQPSAIVLRLDKLGLLENDNQEISEEEKSHEEDSAQDISIPMSTASQYVYDILLESGPLRTTKICDAYIKKANLNVQTGQVYKILNLILSQSEGIVSLGPNYWGLQEHKDMFLQSNQMKIDQKTILDLTNSFCDERFCTNYILHAYGGSQNLFPAFNLTTEMTLNFWAEKKLSQNKQNALLYVSATDQWAQYDRNVNDLTKDQWITKKSSIVNFDMKYPLGSIKLKGFEPDLDTLFQLLVFIKEHKFINYAVADGLIVRRKHNYSYDKSHLIAAYLGYATALDALEINNDWMKKIPAGNRIAQITNIFAAQKYLNGYLNWENENFQFLKENINEVLDKNLIRSSWFESDFFHLL